MAIIAAFAALVIVATTLPARSDWLIQVTRDPATGRMTRMASLSGTNGATLVEACLEKAGGWWDYLSIILLPPNAFKARVERRIRYRLDNGYARDFMAFSENGIVHAPGGGGVEWMSMLTERGAKTLLMETEADDGSHFASIFDLDFSSGESARQRNQMRLDCFLKAKH